MARETDYQTVRDALTTLFAEGVPVAACNNVYKDAVDAHGRLNAEHERLTARCDTLENAYESTAAVSVARSTALAEASRIIGYDVETVIGRGEAGDLIRRMKNLDRIVGSASAVICDFLREGIADEIICDEGTRILEDLLPLMGIEASDIIGVEISTDYLCERIQDVLSTMDASMGELIRARESLVELDGERAADDEAVSEATDEPMGTAANAIQRLREIPEDALY